MTVPPHVISDKLRGMLRGLPEGVSLAKVGGSTIDYSWLKGAAETYKLSPDIKDYLTP